ncbi:unnamed protein product [Pleuronectes platessa]|uniref:Uncharacterized protein n=1 Tax=Pleuronectes platessa TaxID=8262 RepID=A0A9N7UU74_PLEPL|nr:unnamed protein product [Pleuronectes platessa]
MSPMLTKMPAGDAHTLVGVKQQEEEEEEKKEEEEEPQRYCWVYIRGVVFVLSPHGHIAPPWRHADSRRPTVKQISSNSSCDTEHRTCSLGASRSLSEHMDDKE